MSAGALLDGLFPAGEVDRRGMEGALLGGEKFWGLSVVELMPESAWLSSYVAGRCATYAVVDRPPGAGPLADGARSRWRQVMDALGLQPTDPPEHASGDAEPSAGFDVVLLFGALSRAANPLALLNAAILYSNDTVIVVERLPLDTDDGGSPAKHMALIPDPLRPDAWSWQVAPGLIQRLLTEAGFTCRVTADASSHLPAPAGSATVVARRLDRRLAPPRADPAEQTAIQALPALKRRPADVGAAERLPLPPTADRLAAYGTADAEVFASIGLNAFERMAHALARHGSPAGPDGRVLDVGCGFSRVLRWWRMLPTVEVHGTDTDVAAITWNRQQLGFGTFGINTLDPKLTYAAASFGLVYALSMFKHLPGALQLPWARELFRILRPGGYLYLTTHGRSFRGLLPSAYQARFDAGELVSSGPEEVGQASCVAFHPPEWVRTRLVPAIGAELLEVAEASTGVLGEDCWLLRKPNKA